MKPRRLLPAVLLLSAVTLVVTAGGSSASGSGVAGWVADSVGGRDGVDAFLWEPGWVPGRYWNVRIPRFTIYPYPGWPGAHSLIRGDEHIHFTVLPLPPGTPGGVHTRIDIRWREKRSPVWDAKKRAEIGEARIWPSNELFLGSGAQRRGWVYRNHNVLGEPIHLQHWFPARRPRPFKYQGIGALPSHLVLLLPVMEVVELCPERGPLFRIRSMRGPEEGGWPSFEQEVTPLHGSRGAVVRIHFWYEGTDHSWESVLMFQRDEPWYERLVGEVDPDLWPEEGYRGAQGLRVVEELEESGQGGPPWWIREAGREQDQW